MQSKDNLIIVCYFWRRKCGKNGKVEDDIKILIDKTVEDNRNWKTSNDRIRDCLKKIN